MDNEFKSRTLSQKVLTAMKGFFIPFKTERSIRIQSGFVAGALLAGLILEISRNDWLWLLVASAILLIAEIFNTALEKLVDMISPAPSPAAGTVKDISAGAVFLAGITSLVIALIVFIPYL